MFILNTLILSGEQIISRKRIQTLTQQSYKKNINVARNDKTIRFAPPDKQISVFVSDNTDIERRVR